MVERLETATAKTNYVYWVFLMCQEFSKNLECCSNLGSGSQVCQTEEP